MKIEFGLNRYVRIERVSGKLVPEYSKLIWKKPKYIKHYRVNDGECISSVFFIGPFVIDICFGKEEE